MTKETRDAFADLPPSVCALPVEVRDAMGRAWGQAVIETLNRLAMEPVEGKENAYDLGLTKQSPETKSGRRASSPPAVMAEVR